MKWLVFRGDHVIVTVTPAEMYTLPPDFKWMPPWEPIEDESIVLGGRQLLADFNVRVQGGTAGTIADTIADELRREMPPKHRLANCGLRAIGRCTEDSDDILFATDDGSAPLAVVHMTWRVETDAAWPYTTIYHSLDDWVAQMKRENGGVRWANLAEDEE